jgi:hypothetical protein
MTHFFYQIKAKKCDHAPANCFNSPWSFPPIFSGMVEADSRPEAKTKIEEEYGRKFPTRVLAKDLATAEFLLTVRPVVGDGRTLSLFEIRTCERDKCGKTFRVIDKYNDDEEYDKGFNFCTRDCRDKYYEQQKSDYRRDYDFEGIHQPVIYRILNVKTGQSYIGKTTQAFTLRWYQHFFQPSETKFHAAIKDSQLEDWQFQVLERLQLQPGGTKDAIRQLILDKEQHWINAFDAIAAGYNSVPAKKSDEADGMEDLFE